MTLFFFFNTNLPFFIFIIPNAIFPAKFCASLTENPTNQLEKWKKEMLIKLSCFFSKLFQCFRHCLNQRAETKKTRQSMKGDLFLSFLAFIINILLGIKLYPIYFAVIVVDLSIRLHRFSLFLFSIMI